MECRVSDFGFRVSGFGFRISGVESRVSDFGFGVSGLQRARLRIPVDIQALRERQRALVLLETPFIKSVRQSVGKAVSQ